MDNISRADLEKKVWAWVHNNFHRTVINGGRWTLSADSNNPPQIAAGASFDVWKTETKTTPDFETFNNVYPRNTAIEYYIGHAVFEPAARTHTWNSGQFPAKANSTDYFLFCYGAEDINAASQGRGLYGATTTAPTWSQAKNGYYVQLTISAVLTWCRVLGKFSTDSGGNVINIIDYDGGYQKIDQIMVNSSYYNRIKNIALANTAGLTLTLDFNESNIFGVTFGGTTTTVTTVTPANMKIGTILVKVAHGASAANTILFPASNWYHIGYDGAGAKTYSFAGSSTARYTVLSIFYDGTNYYVAYSPFTSSPPTIT